VSAVVLPSPTVYFYYKDTHSATGTRWTNASSAAEGSDDNFHQENPLSMDPSDVYDIEGSELTSAPPSRIKLAKLQREAKDFRVQAQQLQTQNRQLQAETAAKDNDIAAKDNDIAAAKAEIVSLRALTTAKDESTKVQALQAETAALKDQLARRPQAGKLQLAMFSDEAQSTATHQQATEQSSEAVMKEHTTDETLSEETRESAKQALDELAAARIKNLAFERRLALAQEDRKLRGVADAVSEDMTTYLRGHRLLHHADAVIRVVGM
jgi:hypothetical protein